jgi:hypothetical protein
MFHLLCLCTVCLWHLLGRRLVRPQSQSGCGGEGKGHIHHIKRHVAIEVICLKFQVFLPPQ